MSYNKVPLNNVSEADHWIEQESILTMAIMKKGNNALCLYCGSFHLKGEYCRAKGKVCFRCHHPNHFNTQCHFFQDEHKIYHEKGTELLSTLRKAVDQIKELICSAICLESDCAEMTQCVNGHLVCIECQRQLKRFSFCPTCRHEFSRENPPRLISQIIEVLPKTCKHDIRDDNEIYCKYKLTNCKLVSCEWKGMATVLPKHIVESHPNQEIFGSNNTITWKVDDIGERQRSVVPFHFDGYFIWEVSEHDVSEVLLTYHLVPCSKPIDDITVKVTFKSKERELINTMKLNLNPRKIHVPSSLVSAFKNEDGLLLWNVDFFYT